MARKKLKLYVWDGVLTDWTSGIAFALATSPEEAKQMLIEQGGFKEEYHWNGLLFDGQNYTEHETATAGWCYGGG